MTTSWGIVTTVKAEPEKVLAFLAHHLALGAAQITLCFDDPEDPAIEAVAGIEGVTAIACDDAHWQGLNGRPERHQNRQAKNARNIYRQTRLDWLAHVDVDEFLWPEGDIGRILASLPPAQIMLRAEPFEAMHDPALPDDIFTARAFRGALKAAHAHLRAPVLGRWSEVLPEAMLSHSAGKAFFRTGIKGLSPRLHGAFLGGERLPGPPFDPRVRLLHFHAQDRAAWLRALPFRLTRGAYQYHPDLQALLSAASEDHRRAFHQETQSLTPDQATLLREAGRLVEADLALRAKLAAYIPSPRAR